MITVIKIVRTCFACPSQWQGELEDGRFIYIRYRWGYLSCCVGYSAEGAVMGEEVFGKQIGDGFDGTLTYEDLKRETYGEIEFPYEETEENLEEA